MNYKDLTVRLNGRSLAYGFSLRSAGRFKLTQAIWSFLRRLYPDLNQINLMEQSHSTNLSLVVSNQKQINVYGNSDALFYPNPKANQFLIIKTADCLPIIVWNIHGNLGVAHAGWRGSLNQILPKLLDYFLAQSQPENIFIFIGPVIGFCCYPIYGDRLELFRQQFRTWQDKIIILNQDRLSLDLKRLNWLQAQAMDIPSKNISILPSCTSCQANNFFSPH